MFAYGKNKRGFWSRSWCQYEVGIGRYAPEPGSSEIGNVGGVLFFIFPGKPECSSGKYRKPVKDILLSIAKIKPTDWIFYEEEEFMRIIRRFSFKKGFKTFPVEEASKDFAWLIINTFEKFQNLLV